MNGNQINVGQLVENANQSESDNSVRKCIKLLYGRKISKELAINLQTVIRLINTNHALLESPEVLQILPPLSNFLIRHLKRIDSEIGRKIHRRCLKLFRTLYPGFLADPAIASDLQNWSISRLERKFEHNLSMDCIRPYLSLAQQYNLHGLKRECEKRLIFCLEQENLSFEHLRQYVNFLPVIADVESKELASSRELFLNNLCKCFDKDWEEQSRIKTIFTYLSIADEHLLLPLIHHCLKKCISLLDPFPSDLQTLIESQGSDVEWREVVSKVLANLLSKHYSFFDKTSATIILNFDILAIPDDCSPLFWKAMKPVVESYRSSFKTVTWLRIKQTSYYFPCSLLLQATGQFPAISTFTQTITLDCSGGRISIPLHYISASSDFFNARLKPEWTPTEENIVKLTEINLDLIQCALDILMTGDEELVNSENVIDLFQLSHYLGIDKLAGICEIFLGAFLVKYDFNQLFVDKSFNLIPHWLRAKGQTSLDKDAMADIIDLVIALLGKKEMSLTCSEELQKKCYAFLTNCLRQLSGKNVEAFRQVVSKLVTDDISLPEIELDNTQNLKEQDFVTLSLLGPFTKIFLIDCDTEKINSLMSASEEHLASLQTLILQKCKSLTALSFLPSCSNLRLLDLSNSTAIKIEELEVVGKLTCLQELYLDHCWPEDIDLSNLIISPIRLLSIKYCQLSLQQLNYLNQFPHLQVLHLNHCWQPRYTGSVDNSTGQMYSIPNLPPFDFRLWQVNPFWKEIHLKELFIDQNLIGQLQSIRKLKVLDLEGCIGEIDYSIIFALPNLVELNIIDCPVFPADLLSNLQYLSRFRTLHITSHRDSKELRILRERDIEIKPFEPPKNCRLA